MAEGFHSTADAKTLERVLDLAKSNREAPRTSAGELTPAFQSYIEQLVRFATGDDRHWDEPAGLLARAIEAFRTSATRQDGRPVVALKLQKSADWRESRLVLDIATDDMPFLVDSVTSALAEAGKQVSFFVNAVVNVSRDGDGRRIDDDAANSPESMIHAEMDPPIDNTEVAGLQAEIEAVLADVSLAVADFPAMAARMRSAIDQLKATKFRGGDAEMRDESIEFLEKLHEAKFTFLGVRRYYYSIKDGRASFTRDKEGDLGILKDIAKRVLKTTFSDEGELSGPVAAFMASPDPIIITKANVRSTVHRRVHLDYVGVKLYDEMGNVKGEERFVGLLTSDIYNRPASDLPILNLKVRRAVEVAGFKPGGHNAKALVHILETFPRDELLQADVDALRETALGILRLYKRPRTKLFLRRDRFDRFVSALVFVPRDRFSSTVREEIGASIATAYDGHVAAFHPHFGDASLVRIHYIIGLKPGAPEGPTVAELTQRIRLITRNWSDDFLDALRAAHDGATPQGIFKRYEHAFDVAYRDQIKPTEAIDDVAVIEGMGSAPQIERVFKRAGDPDHVINIKLYRRGESLKLSRIIPPLEHLGLSVAQEATFEVTPAEGIEPCVIHDFRAEESMGRPIDLDAARSHIEEALNAIFSGRTEDDRFNALVVSAGLNWREAWLLRAAAKFLLQTGVQYSQGYIEQTLSKNPAIARALIAVFHARFNPSGPAKMESRVQELDAAVSRVRSMLDSVESLDEDRILRRFLNLILAMVRTNYFLRHEDGSERPYISFKIVSSAVEGLPEPVPYREIFMSGPRVDGIHLRFGPIARGGLRWSDRPEDFRTEVLGLVKAQRVKNAVIVPTGSKGGFFPKRLPSGGDRASVFEEGRQAYIEFIRGLLDITDNIIDGKALTPKNVVRWDDEDPYLVVAADKGTATFSDTANGVSAEYGFWLGDAFASGGSAGYDHKVMGITARGAWEAVKRHFREMGKDIQKEPFTVAGIGDMSGDVFGNGMLLSKKTRLVAAFDHRDIFIDPNPDPATSFAERKRLFALSRSSWQDYDKQLISQGGGVFSRSLKSIRVTPEMRSLLGLHTESATPQDLMRAILKSEVDLFWLGGIGTYFKASYEDNSRVGDRANDAIRINADEMRMKVVGEGANLGLTQAARVAFALAGGRINTDAIDNSAGVDSSDHEVNIKILLSAAVENGELEAAARDALLKKMTDDVAAHVLQHNYDQTRALSLMQKTAAQDNDAYQRLMSRLESQGRLDRVIEGLPDDKAIAARKLMRAGLTRPELAVLLAYSKMEIFEELVKSKAPDDPMFERELGFYFPQEAHKFSQAIKSHRLRREIIATRISNEIVDTCGATFMDQLIETSGAGFADVALSYEAARRILDLRDFGVGVDALDNKVPASLQIALYWTAVKLLEEQVNKIVSNVEASNTLSRSGIKGVVDHYRGPIQLLKTALPSILPADEAQALAARADSWKAQGAPEDLANQAALMPALEFAFDIVNLSRATNWTTETIGAVFFAAGRSFSIAPSRIAARDTIPEGHYDRLAADRLRDELSLRQGDLAIAIARTAKENPSSSGANSVDDLIDGWRERHAQEVSRYERFISDVDIGSGMSIGKLSLMNRKLSELIERTSAAA